jgi:hypothetical protein
MVSNENFLFPWICTRIQGRKRRIQAIEDYSNEKKEGKPSPLPVLLVNRL